MAKKIKIDIEVNGKMQKATVSTKKLKAALDGVDAAQEKVGKSARTADRNIKGVAQTSANSTKNFSKMSQGIGGVVVPAYAALAANVFAVTAAFSAFRNAAQLEQLESSLVRVGAVGGQNLLAVADSLRDITNSAISTDEALRATAQGAAQGFSTSQLQDLTTVAKGASIALGRELGDALDRLIRGTAKLEPEILDELGIIVRLDQATEDYAISLNKTADSLTQFERQQAFANAVTTQGLKKFGDIAKIAKANPYDKLAATFMDLKKDVFDGLNAVLGPFIGFLSESPTALVGIVSLLGATIVNQLTPALSDMAAASAASFSVLSKEASDAAKKVQTQYGKAAKKLKDIDIAPKGFKELLPSIKAGTAGLKDFEKAERSLNASQRGRIAGITKLEEAGKGLRGSQKAAHELLLQEKRNELALIESQQQALLRLKAIEETGTGKSTIGGSATAAKNAGARSKQAGIASNAFSTLGTVGILGGFGLAKDTFKDMSKAADEAGDSLEKFKGKGRAAGTAAKLLGTNLLRMVPYLGLIMLAAELAGAALKKIFPDFFKGKSEVEKAAEEVQDNLSNISDAAFELQMAVLDTSDAFEKQFIIMKGTTGLVVSAGQAFSDLARKMSSIKADKIAELREEAKKLRQEVREGQGKLANFLFEYFAIGQSPNAIKKELQAKVNEIADAIETPASIESAFAMDVAKGAQFELIAAGINKQSAGMKELDKIIESIGRKKIITVQELAGFKKQIDEVTKGELAFQASIESLPGAFAEVEKAMGGLVRKTQTVYTPIIASLKTATNELDNIFSDANMKRAGEGGMKLMDAIQNQAGPLAKSLISNEDLVNITMSMKPGSGIEEINEAIKALVTGKVQKLAAEFDAADKAARNTKIEVAKLKEELKPLSAASKTSVGFLDLELEKRLDINKVQRLSLEAQRDALDENSKLEEVIDKRKSLANEINVLEAEELNIKDTVIQKATTLLAVKKQELDIQNRLTSAIQKQQDLQRQIVESGNVRELRVERESYGSDQGFEFLDRGRFEMGQKIRDEERKLADLTSQNQIDINSQKKAMIKAEYALLRAQLQNQISISRTKATTIAADENATEPQKLAGATLLEEAKKLETLLPTLLAAETTAVANVGLATEAKIAGISAVISELNSSKSDLSDVSFLVDGVQDRLETGLADAFVSIVDGTKSAKAAFADMAKSILKYIIEMTIKMLIFRAISGLFGSPSGGIPTNVTNAGGGLTSAVDPASFNIPAFSGSGRTGGVFSQGRKMPGYSAGGIARGSQAGYPAMLHGTEAVVPLPNGRSIPVQMSGAAQENNVTVNVAVDNQGSSTTSTQSEGDAGNFGKAIAQVVQAEIQKQKRAGGMLSPYGV